MVVFYRKMPRFDYLRPRSLKEALEAISGDHPLKHQVYAGGTDLLLKLKLRRIKAPGRIIDLKGIRGLDYVDWHPENGLRIGAVAIISAVGKSPLVREKFTALAEAAGLMASDQIQNRGTIVGNVCSAFSSADTGPPLLVHDAQVVCVSLAGERTIALADFFRGPGEVALRDRELVKEIRLPPPHPLERTTYLKLAPRGRMDLAFVGAAAGVVVDGGVVRAVRIGLGSAAPVPVRAPEAEAALLDRPLSTEAVANAARVAAHHSRPRGSHRASAEYRRMMIEVLVRRALTRLAAH